MDPAEKASIQWIYKMIICVGNLHKASAWGYSAGCDAKSSDDIAHTKQMSEHCVEVEPMEIIAVSVPMPTAAEDE